MCVSSKQTQTGSHHACRPGRTHAPAHTRTRTHTHAHTVPPGRCHSSGPRYRQSSVSGGMCVCGCGWMGQGMVCCELNPRSLLAVDHTRAHAHTPNLANSPPPNLLSSHTHSYPPTCKRTPGCLILWGFDLLLPPQQEQGAWWVPENPRRLRAE